MDPADDAAVNRTVSRRALWLVIAFYLSLSAIFGSTSLDIDEFTFVREPYELLGGDYTFNYIKQHQYARAAHTAAKSYAFYWKYRPLFSPLISPEDQRLFATEEHEFGYVKPQSVSKQDPDPRASYAKRLIVPEPDRFYSHGAGKPLLAAVLSLPQLALVKLATSDSRNLLYYQYSTNYHPVFILTRLAQILAGLATILIVYWILARECGQRAALLGAAIVAVFPISVKYFPNIHHDSILVPFLISSAYFFYRRQYARAGVCFGLALAAKNVAIILIPLFIGYALIAAWRARESPSGSEPRRVLRAKARGVLVTMGLGVLVLLPFADPVSYASEILTPLTHRAHDVRGENVEEFTMSSRLLGAGSGKRISAARPLQMLIRFEDNGFFFLVIAVALFWPHPRHPLARMCFAMLLLALPYGLEFGNYLNYRQLLFVPFFAVLCALIAPRRYLWGLIAILVCVDLLLALDPIATGYHTPVNDETLWTTLTKALADR
jgi:hypothetical protein